MIDSAKLKDWDLQRGKFQQRTRRGSLRCTRTVGCAHETSRASDVSRAIDLPGFLRCVLLPVIREKIETEENNMR